MNEKQQPPTDVTVTPSTDNRVVEAPMNRPRGEDVPSQSTSEMISTMAEGLCALTGTEGRAIAGRIAAQMQSLQIGDLDLSRRLAIAIDCLAELRPSNAMESMLAVQMVGAHEAAVVFLRNATAESQSTEGRDAHLLRATRLMGLFLQQLEAMQKLKGKAVQQRVTVEHVHVHKGGKAIVGAVSASPQTSKEASDDKAD